MTAPSKRAHYFAVTGSVLLIVVGSMRMLYAMLWPVIGHFGSGLSSEKRWRLGMERITNHLHLTSSGFNALLAGLVVAWLAHVIVGGFAVANRPWARKGGLMISGIYLIGLVGMLIGPLTGDPFRPPSVLLIGSLLIYAAIYYCFIRFDVKEMFERRDLA